MSEYVDARIMCWGNTDCEYQVMVNEPYQDWDGDWHDDYKWENKLRCECVPINPKQDYCKTCGKTLVYP